VDAVVGGACGRARRLSAIRANHSRITAVAGVFAGHAAGPVETGATQFGAIISPGGDELV